MRIRPRRRHHHSKATWRAEPVPAKKSQLINRTTGSHPLPPPPPPPTFPNPAPDPPPGWEPRPGWCCDCGYGQPEPGQTEPKPNICLPNQPCCPGTAGPIP